MLQYNKNVIIVVKCLSVGIQIYFLPVQHPLNHADDFQSKIGFGILDSVWIIWYSGSTMWNYSRI